MNWEAIAVCLDGQFMVSFTKDGVTEKATFPDLFSGLMWLRDRVLPS